MISPTRKEQHEILFNQFIKELFCDPIKKYNKPKSTLSTRAKFLQKMKEQELKDPGNI